MKKSLNKAYLYDQGLCFLVSLLGVVLNFYVWNFANLNNVLVNVSFVLLYSLLFPGKHDDMFFTATLAAMSSRKVLPGPGWVILLGVFVFIVFKLWKPIFLGLGGKYGTMGFIANFITVFFVYVSGVFEYPVYNFDYYLILDYKILVFGPIIAGANCFLSMIFHNYFGLSKHVSVNTDGLLFSLLLLLIIERPELHGKDFPTSYGEFYCIFAHIGLLAALTKEEFLSLTGTKDKKAQFWKHYFLIGYLGGWIYIAVIPYFIFGGKNGFMAFSSNNIYVRGLRGLRKLRKKFKSHKKTDGNHRGNSHNNNHNIESNYAIPVTERKEEDNELTEPSRKIGGVILTEPNELAKDIDYKQTTESLRDCLEANKRPNNLRDEEQEKKIEVA